MNSRLRPWLGSAFLAVQLVSGCRHADPTGPVLGQSRLPAAPGEQAVLAGGKTPDSFRILAAEPPNQEVPAVCTTTASRKRKRAPWAGEGIGSERPAAELLPASSRADEGAASSQGPAPVRQASLARPRTQTASASPPGTQPRSRVADLEGPVPAHAADYRWLVGVLHPGKEPDSWTVRYSEEESDRYGGSLELVNPGSMSGFCAGQVVRVEGELVDPAPHEIKPAYRVRAIQALQPR